MVKIPDGMREAGKERRRRERRRAIALACHERLAAEGLAAATLDDLARDAGLSKQNLLFYFADKADLWNEAVVAAAEVLFPVLNRLVEGEAGMRAIRALRRALDEVERVLPAPLAIWLDGPHLPGATAEQRSRAVLPQTRFLEGLARALAVPRTPGLAHQRLARFALQSLLSPRREARAHARSGLVPPISLAAELDWIEAQLVALASGLRVLREDRP